MPVQRKTFRIELAALNNGATELLQGIGISSTDRQEILAELQARFDRIAHDNAELTEPAATAGANELHQLKSETDAIYQALNRTKQEIASLHANAFAPPPARMMRELDAVVASAEHATQQILAASEAIDDDANNLSASLKDEQAQALALDIRENVQRIFEACNFQDLTGQRIFKVLDTLKFIEERVAQMMEIWGGTEAFKSHLAAATPECGTTLRGPKLEGDIGHASQTDVDAIFAK